MASALLGSSKLTYSAIGAHEGEGFFNLFIIMAVLRLGVLFLLIKISALTG